MSKNKKTETAAPTQFRQGDVLIERVDEIPADVAEDDECVLALGEATGHAHRIREGATQYRTASGQQFIRVMRAVVDLVHEEHGTINLPAGTYRIGHQREYSPEQNRAVMD